MIVRINDSLAYRVYRAARLLRKHFLDLGRRNGLDLSPEQWFILNKLRHEDGQSQVDLGEAIFSDRPNMTRMLKTMESSALVARRADPEDARRTLVFLTERGRAVEGAYSALVPDARSRIFRGIAKEDVDTVVRVLAHLEKNLESELD